jgi:hypothetical protein
MTPQKKPIKIIFFFYFLKYFAVDWNDLVDHDNRFFFIFQFLFFCRKICCIAAAAASLRLYKNHHQPVIVITCQRIVVADPERLESKPYL